jgi:hypothetical protein
MLIISNGAPKSGSTWLLNILREITQFPPPPKIYLNDNINPSFEKEKLSIALSELDYSSNNYLVKNHFGLPEQRDLLLETSDIKVLDITRDIKDVVVSYYFHALKHEGFSGDFKRFYWMKGRYLANDVRGYHLVWQVDAGERVFVASYERLLEDFEEEVTRIGNFIGFDLDSAKIQDIKRKTSLLSLRDKYQDEDEIKFFRKGIAGDWKNYMDGNMLRDIGRIEAVGLSGFNLFQRIFGRFLKEIYHFKIIRF